MTAACLFAVMPHALAGLRLRAASGPVREHWLELFFSMLDRSTPVQRIHPQIDDAALIGGLDLAATLARGATVVSEGVLTKADSGVLVLSMAERCSTALGARIAAALDSGSVTLEREGITATRAAAFGLILLDEGEDGEMPPAALLDRVSLEVDLTAFSIRDLQQCSFGTAELEAARRHVAAVRLPEEMMDAIASAALKFGVMPLRTSMLACAVARASAALFGRSEVEQSDAALAARLVLVPRALAIPERLPEATLEADDELQHDQQPTIEDRQENNAGEAALEQQSAEANGQGPSESRHPDDQNGRPADDAAREMTSEAVLEATMASLPDDLLNRLVGRIENIASASSGRSGHSGVNASHGRPLTALPQQAAGNTRLDLISTLRAAVPWQALRRNERQQHGSLRDCRAVEVRRQDFRGRRYVRRSRTTTIFAVDASGSTALHRLSETKGAVELMLGQCYLRRDQVAVISFRDNGATLALPPTRSLVRAKRSLAGMVGGGGTPLAAALDALVVLADSIRRHGDRPVIVVLSDGKANVAADQSRNREVAHQDAMRAALTLRRLQLTSLFVDTSMQPGERAATIANQMGARYLALPFVDAHRLSRAVMDVS